MQWDSQNRMRQCVVGYNTSTFEYGPDGLRRSMTVDDGVDPPVTTNHILDGQSVAQEWVDADSDDAKDLGEVVSYLAGPRGVECRQRPPRDDEIRCLWRRADAIRLDGLEERLRRVAGPPGRTLHRRIDLHARPLVRSGEGQVLSEDPAKDGVNWYAYCGSNPVNNTDPTGCIVGIDDWFAMEGEDAERVSSGVRGIQWGLRSIREYGQNLGMDKQTMKAIIHFAKNMGLRGADSIGIVTEGAYEGAFVSRSGQILDWIDIFIDPAF